MANSQNVIAATVPAGSAAVFAAPLGTTLPTDAEAALDAAFVDLGYISEDGVTNVTNKETTKHYAWGGDVVKTTLDRYTETVRFALLESSAAALKMAFGEDNVTETPAAAGTPGKITVKHSSLMLSRQVVVIEFIDGDLAGRLLVKEGQVTEIGDMTYTNTGLLMYDLTVDCFKPADGSDAVEVYFKTPALPEAATATVRRPAEAKA